MRYYNFLYLEILGGGGGGGKKNIRISVFSGSCLFDKIEREPPLNTEKFLWVMKRTGKATLGHFLLNSTGLEYARIVWGGSHSQG